MFKVVWQFFVVRLRAGTQLGPHPPTPAFLRLYIQAKSNKQFLQKNCRSDYRLLNISTNNTNENANSFAECMPFSTDKKVHFRHSHRLKVKEVFANLPEALGVELLVAIRARNKTRKTKGKRKHLKRR